MHPTVPSRTPRHTDRDRKAGGCGVVQYKLHQIPEVSGGMAPGCRRSSRSGAAVAKLMKRLRNPPGRGSAVMEASRRYRHYSPL